MTTKYLSELSELTKIVVGEELEIKGLYCCDLLSHVMGESLEGNVWCTVMANINSLAVASLSDAACVILCHGLEPSPDMIEKAKQQDINLFTTQLPEFDAALLVGKKAGLL